MKKFISFFFLFFLLFPGVTYAQEKFTTGISSSYNIYENDPTEVVWSYTIKNKTSDFIVSRYKVFINYPKAFNISVTDAGGEVKFDSKKSNGGVELTLNFDNKVAGINREKEFQVRFNTDEIFKNSLNSQEVNINKVPNSEGYSINSAEVNLPDSFSENLIVKPQVHQGTNNKLSFRDIKSAIKILSGKERIYDLELLYELYNTNLFATSMEIAIPHDNAYQQVYILDISPKPENIRMDEDGNYLARYNLKPSEKLKIKVNEKVKVSLTSKFPETYNFDSNGLVRERKYWEVNHSSIKGLARNKNVSEIYNYLVNNNSYSTKSEKRTGALKALSDPNSSSSMDYVDSFIAMTRSGGIPSRMIQGFLATDSNISSDKDLIHVWGEYFNKDLEKWIQVDPALGDANSLDYLSSMDLDHITFSTHGTDSENPKPAGTYKISDAKSISVKISEQFGLPKPQIKLRPEFKDKYIGGFKINGKIYFKNLTGAKIENQSFTLTSEVLEPGSQNVQIPPIPPYGEVSVDVSFDPQPLLTKEVDTFKITLGQSTISEDFQITPFYTERKFILILIGGLIIVTAITIFTVARRTRHI